MSMWCGECGGSGTITASDGDYEEAGSHEEPCGRCGGSRMAPLKVKIRAELRGGHYHCIFWTGQTDDGGALANSGTVVVRKEEFPEFESLMQKGGVEVLVKEPA